MALIGMMLNLVLKNKVNNFLGNDDFTSKDGQQFPCHLQPSLSYSEYIILVQKNKINLNVCMENRYLPHSICKY